MSSKLSAREELTSEFFVEISRWSTWTVIYHQAVAVHVGLNPTDLKTAAVLQEAGPITAGELADRIGLTTGAVTGVLDRLEKAGLLIRERDREDRRRVYVRITEDPQRLEAVNQVFTSLAGSTTELLAPYSDQELAVIVDFVRRGRDLMEAEIAKLRDQGKGHT